MSATPSLVEIDDRLRRLQRVLDSDANLIRPSADDVERIALFLEAAADTAHDDVTCETLAAAAEIVRAWSGVQQ